MESIIISISTSLTFLLVFYLFRKLVPYKPIQIKQKYFFESLKLNYARWENIALGRVFIIIPIMCYLIFIMLTSLAALIEYRFESYKYVLMPFWVFWLLPAFFLGIIGAAVPIKLILKHQLKEKYEEYEIYQNMKYGFDGEKVMRIISKIILVLSTIYLVFMFDFYAAFSDSEIVINDLLSLSERRYQYSDVRSVAFENVYYTNESASLDTSYVIEFNDGKRWLTRLGPADDDKIDYYELMHYVARLSGVPFNNSILDPQQQ